MWLNREGQVNPHVREGMRLPSSAFPGTGLELAKYAAMLLDQKPGIKATPERAFSFSASGQDTGPTPTALFI